MLLGICQGHFYAKARLYLRLAPDKACFYTLFRCYSPNFALWIVAVISLCHTPTRNAVKRYAQSTSNVMIAHTATQIFRWFFQSLRTLSPPFSLSVWHGTKQGVKTAVKRLRSYKVLRLRRTVMFRFLCFLLIEKIPQRFTSLGKLHGNVYKLFTLEMHRRNSNDYLVIYSTVPNIKDC